MIVKDELKPPIFLLGNVRSGTSMLYRFFDMHPEVKAWYEPRTIWVYADPHRDHDRFDACDATPRVVRYIRKRFLKFQRKHGGLRIMEKTPSNMMRIPYVRAIFPESKFAYIVREPLANLSSSELKWRKPITLSRALERFGETPKSQLPWYVWRAIVDHARVRLLRQKHVSIWGVRYPGIYDDRERLSVEQIIARQWVACSQQAKQDLADIDPKMILRLRYEDFVADPVAQFSRMLEHFDLTITPHLERALTEQVDPNRQMKWRRLDPQVIAECRPLLEDEMARHGYRVPDEVRSSIEQTGSTAGTATPDQLASSG